MLNRKTPLQKLEERSRELEIEVGITSPFEINEVKVAEGDHNTISWVSKQKISPVWLFHGDCLTVDLNVHDGNGRINTVWFGYDPTKSP